MADRHRKQPGTTGRNRRLLIGLVVAAVVVVVVAVLVVVLVARSTGSDGGSERSAYCDQLERLPFDRGLRQAVHGASVSELDAIRRSAPSDVETAWDDLVAYRQGDTSFTGAAGRVKRESDQAVVVLDAGEHCALTVKP